MKTKTIAAAIGAALALAFTGCAAETEPVPEGADPLWSEGAQPAVELVARPSLPAPDDPSSAVAIERAAATTAPVVAVPTPPVCAPAAEVPCDGIDQDCDRTDLCDANGDGIAEAYAPTGDPFVRRGVTTE